MMNLYLCISEEVNTVVPVLDYGVGPIEYYHIAELVVARNRGQAKWLAWINDKDQYWLTIRDMPRFSVRIKAKNVEGEPRIVSDDDAFQEYWEG